MTTRPRRNHSLTCKAKAALAIIRRKPTLMELSRSATCNANQIKQWKDQPLGETGVFGNDAKEEQVAPTVDVKTLHASSGR